MDRIEQAARVLLGDLDQPGKSIRDLLGDLRTEDWNRLSAGEAARVDLAHQLWTGQTGSTTLADAFRILDEDGLRDLLKAVLVARPDLAARVDA
jgi:hypothetical protein